MRPHRGVIDPKYAKDHKQTLQRLNVMNQNPSYVTFEEKKGETNETESSRNRSSILILMQEQSFLYTQSSNVNAQGAQG